MINNHISYWIRLPKEFCIQNNRHQNTGTPPACSAIWDWVIRWTSSKWKFSARYSNSFISTKFDEMQPYNRAKIKVTVPTLEFDFTEVGQLLITSTCRIRWEIVSNSNRWLNSNWGVGLKQLFLSFNKLFLYFCHSSALSWLQNTAKVCDKVQTLINRLTGTSAPLKLWPYGAIQMFIIIVIIISTVWHSTGITAEQTVTVWACAA